MFSVLLSTLEILLSSRVSNSVIILSEALKNVKGPVVVDLGPSCG